MLNITNEGFIWGGVDDDMTQRAIIKDRQMGILNNSIRNGEGNLAGFIGEEAVLRAWPGATSCNTFHHDIECDGIKYEVKTKDRTVAPRLSYEASVANFNSTQTADFYVFVSLYRIKHTQDYVRYYILGIYPTSEYKKNCIFRKKGDYDPSNRYTVKADCFNLGHERLYRFENWAA